VHLTVAQTAEHQAAIHASQAVQAISSPTLSPTPSQTSFQSPIAGLSSGSDATHPPTNHAHIHPMSSSSEYNLKIQALKSLVMVLRSLVAWAQQGIAATIESGTTQDEVPQPSAEDSPRAGTPNPPVRSASQGDTRPSLVDDPSQFEALKYRKTALADAIQKFNFKPKKVRYR